MNSSFDSAVLRVAYTGENRNGSYISKETFQNCLQTIYNCPVVCNYDRDTDTIGGHDVDIVRSGNGLRMVNATVPVGVVPESAQPYWEAVEEDDGTVHEYLCVDVLLWKRQEAYSKIKKDGITSESMEITVRQGGVDKDSGLFVIHDFEFTAFCLLGDSVEPCFESASLEFFSSSDFKKMMFEMMAELKDTLSETKTAEYNADASTQNSSTEGGNALEEDIVFVDENGSADVAVPAEETGETFAEVEPVTEVTEVIDEQMEDTFALAGQFQMALAEALEFETISDEYGDYPRYYFHDYDSDKAEVYAFDSIDYKLYGFSYTVSGDAVAIDFASKKRMKIVLEDFDDGSQDNPILSTFEKLANAYKAKMDECRSAYANIAAENVSLKADVEKYSQINLDELDSLRKFKADVEAEKAQADREDILAQFSYLVGIDEFDTLTENCASYSMEDLEEKCYAIKGRYGMNAKFTANTDANKIVVPKTEVEVEPYGGFIRDYKNK